MDFRQLSRDDDWAVTSLFKKILQSSPNPMGCLEENDCPSHLPEPFEPFISVFCPNRRESVEGEHLGWRPRHGDGGQYRRGAWNGFDPNPSRNGIPDEASAGVGNRRRTCVRHERDGLAAQE